MNRFLPNLLIRSTLTKASIAFHSFEQDNSKEEINLQLFFEVKGRENLLLDTFTFCNITVVKGKAENMDFKNSVC